jgi:transposase
MAECRDFCAMCGGEGHTGNDPGDRFRPEHHAPEVGDEVAALVSLVWRQRQAPCRARRLTVDHLQRRLALAVAIGVGQVRLHHEPVAVLHQRGVARSGLN